MRGMGIFDRLFFCLSLTITQLPATHLTHFHKTFINKQTHTHSLDKQTNEQTITNAHTQKSGVEHGFTDFELDAYNEWVDGRSWTEMATFLMERFGKIGYGTKELTEGVDYLYEYDNDNSNSTVLLVPESTRALPILQPVEYYDNNGFPLLGYIATPPGFVFPNNDGEDDSDDDKKLPGVVVLLDWDGVNGPFTGYEPKRAAMIANQEDYAAMAANIYGADHATVDNFQTRIELSTKYRDDPELFSQRVSAAVEFLASQPYVDEANIFIAGYCFGGTGAIDYAFSSPNDNNSSSGVVVRAVVPFHRGLNPLRAV